MKKALILFIVALAPQLLPGHTLSWYRDVRAARLAALDYAGTALDLLPSYLNEPIYEPGEGSQMVLIRRDRGENALYIMALGASGAEEEPPLVAAGNSVIRRNLESGAIESIKLFLRPDPGVYVRMVREGGRTRLSVFLYSQRAFLDRIYVDLPLERIYGFSLDHLMEVTSRSIPWDRLLYTPGLEDQGKNDRIADHSRKIASLLPLLPDAEDGAMDQDGNLVSISTLGLQQLPGFNCSGFAKWIADGYARVQTGKGLSIEGLKERLVDFRGTSVSAPYEESRDPWFGLDWTRNIASSLAGGRGEDNDLRSVDYHYYTEDQGFPTESISTLLYLSTQERPGHIYFASVNGPFGSEPQLWQHYHVVVFYPYFRADGRFILDVYERNVASSAASLVRRYPGTNTHLVSVPIPGPLDLPIPR